MNSTNESAEQTANEFRLAGYLLFSPRIREEQDWADIQLAVYRSHRPSNASALQWIMEQYSITAWDEVARYASTLPEAAHIEVIGTLRLIDSRHEVATVDGKKLIAHRSAIHLEATAIRELSKELN